MIGKVIELLKHPENFGIFLFLAYTIGMTKLIGYFLMTWCWQA